MAGYAHKLVAGYVHKFLAGYVHKLMAGRVHKLLAGNFHRIVAGYVHKLVAGYGTLLRDSKKLLPRHSCGHSCKTRLPPLDRSTRVRRDAHRLVAGYVHKLAGYVGKLLAGNVHIRGRLCA